MTNEEAIRILESMKSEMLLCFDHDRKEALKLAITALRAQPEPFTDKEQRIFLRAMEREDKVCKHVDNVYNDSYEDSLVRTCHEITRKVKGALWT